MKLYVMLNFYLVTLSFKFHKDLCINGRTQVVKARMFYREYTRLRLVGVYLSTDLHKIQNFSSQDNN